jgi:hypothetical protein
MRADACGLLPVVLVVCVVAVAGCCSAGEYADDCAALKQRKLLLLLLQASSRARPLCQMSHESKWETCPPLMLRREQVQQQQKEANRLERHQRDLAFMSYDRQVLEQMEPFIREQVPFLATAKGAIDSTLLQLLKLLAVSGMGFSTLVARLQELHHWRYLKQMLVYYSFAAAVEPEEADKRGEFRSTKLCWSAACQQT